MNLKQLILIFVVAFQTIFSSTAFAWSPLDGVETVVERMQYCYFTTASSEGEEEGSKKKGEEEEEEEEPDCE